MSTFPGEAIDTIRAPSADEINALPKSVRDYIHDLNVGYDPRGDVRRQVIELHIARESATALAWENLRLHRIVRRLLRAHSRSTAAPGATLTVESSAPLPEDSRPPEPPPCSCPTQPRTGEIVCCGHDRHGVRCRRAA